MFHDVEYPVRGNNTRATTFHVLLVAAFAGFAGPAAALAEPIPDLHLTVGPPLPSISPSVVPPPATIVGNGVARFSNATADHMTGRVEAVGAIGAELVAFGPSYVFEVRVYHDDGIRWMQVERSAHLRVLALGASAWTLVADVPFQSEAAQDAYVLVPANLLPGHVPLNVLVAVQDGSASRVVEYNPMRNALVDAGQLYLSDRADIVPLYAFS